MRINIFNCFYLLNFIIILGYPVYQFINSLKAKKEFSEIESYYFQKGKEFQIIFLFLVIFMLKFLKSYSLEHLLSK